jgi:hypothetical protein
LLLIEWEELDIDSTGALVDGGWNPQNLTIAVDDHVGLIRHFVFTIGAEK